jgi:hypothetical protein
MKKTSSKINALPWYKVGMVWIMIGLPFTVVVASMVTLVIAHQNAPIIITDSTNNR